MSAIAAFKNIKSIYIFTLLTLLMSTDLHAASSNLIPQSVAEQLTQDLVHKKIEVREEALIRLRWAGISDERVFDPIMEKLQSNKKMVPKYAKIYITALVYSGNPKYLGFLDGLIEDKKYTNKMRNLAKKHKPEFEQYQSISAVMNQNNNTENSEVFWANRYEKGLRVADRARMRWAARDLYLTGFNEPSYDVAKTFLAENYKTEADDSYLIDAMAFLCKSLGLSRNTKYKDILVEVANHTPNKKLAKYAERSVQYFDQAFESTNTVLKK